MLPALYAMGSISALHVIPLYFGVHGSTLVYKSKAILFCRDTVTFLLCIDFSRLDRVFCHVFARN